MRQITNAPIDLLFECVGDPFSQSVNLWISESEHFTLKKLRPKNRFLFFLSGVKHWNGYIHIHIYSIKMANDPNMPPGGYPAPPGKPVFGPNGRKIIYDKDGKP